MTTSTERFCWVKTVRLDPTDTTAGLRAQRLAEVLSMPGIKAPPAPDGKLIEPRECGAIAKGGNTNPPNGQDMRAMPDASNKTGDRYWAAASYAPGADIAAGDPVMTLAFQPIAGDRCAAAKWRLENPDWFSDAVAVSLLSNKS